jgi:hypothetical protein
VVPGLAGWRVPQLSKVDGAAESHRVLPGTTAPSMREAPHSTPFNCPERVVTGNGLSNVSQNASGAEFSCMPQELACEITILPASAETTAAPTIPRSTLVFAIVITPP